MIANHIYAASDRRNPRWLLDSATTRQRTWWGDQAGSMSGLCPKSSSPSMYRAYIRHASETIHGISLVLSHPSRNSCEMQHHPHLPLHSLDRRPVYAIAEIPISPLCAELYFQGLYGSWRKGSLISPSGQNICRPCCTIFVDDTNVWDFYIEGLW
jgi:hypothetical protein